LVIVEDLVVVVDDVRREERIVTVYEPEATRWHPVGGDDANTTCVTTANE